MTNPLSQGLRIERKAPPCVIVIFGASGDLNKRKLMPALYSLYQQHLLGSSFATIGIGRTQMDNEAFRELMTAAVREFAEGGLADEDVWRSFAKQLHYIAGDPREQEVYVRLGNLLDELDKKTGTAGNRIFYLSTPPELYTPIVTNLGKAKLNVSPVRDAWVRIIIEKPFGYDLKSALALNEHVGSVFQEEQVYRIDHYLGKETVQNVMVFRFANGIFEPLWNHKYIDHVQITAAEAVGVEGRAGYYEGAGALRDMIQNHLLQVFSLIAMEPPVSLDASAIRDEKQKVMMAVRPIEHGEVNAFAVRGQYGQGTSNGRAVMGYREEKGVNPQSTTETYAMVKLLVDNWRWAGVPFYIRSGKRMPRRVSEVAIQFKEVPHLLFDRTAADRIHPNTLVMRIQPDEGITLRFSAKLPGQAVHIRDVNMDFQYGTQFGRHSPEAYERLLLDCMLGDPTLFARRDMVEKSWELLMPILDVWAADKPKFPNYEAGSWGPAAADEFLAKDGGRRWRRP
ncbi:MAG: glucose-6-phosphate dehydrogenase [Acidobacteriota bacterium]|nr:glucose-6-phosphate dehydrogenase [Blastocatellia bacterium]MDW8411898.1 glucose-6-phosphate dehydrogenase [Acidobacteriota bacterium]